MKYERLSLTASSHVFIDWILLHQRWLRLQKQKLLPTVIKKKSNSRQKVLHKITSEEKPFGKSGLHSKTIQEEKRHRLNHVWGFSSAKLPVTAQSTYTLINPAHWIIICPPVKQNSHSFPKWPQPRLPLAEFIGQRSLHTGFSSSHTSINWLMQPQKGQTCQPLVNGVRTNRPPKPPWCAGTLRTSFSDTSLYACKCKLPLASGNKQNKCCSSANTEVLHNFNILLTDSLLPKVLPPAFSACSSLFF